jgi:SAM-dependent methyltransferase
VGDRAQPVCVSPTGTEAEAEPAALTDPLPVRNANNYRITDADGVGAGSLRQKCRGNLDAIALLKELEQEQRQPDVGEKRILIRYVGWGGLPQVFDPGNAAWAEERTRLEALLTPEEWESARATTLNAHYTAPLIIRAMYALLQQLGFAHGRILEPACGLGHFIGLMPDAMHTHSQITGIEIDSVTTRIARLLYPDADLRQQPFEAARLADGFFDVAISNIPFGDYKPFDPQFKSWGFVIHDYFFAKALDKVRPGGLVLFITSKGTMDKLDGSLREYVSHQADLLGAIRLPNDAFKKNANTEVTTDIIVLQKRALGEIPSGPAWKSVVEITNSLGEEIFVNEYFAAHPQMMLGEMRLEGRMYRDHEPTLVSNGRDLADQLVEVIARFPRDLYTALATRVASPGIEQVFPTPEHVKPNAYTVVNDRIGIRDGDQIRLLTDLPSSRAQRIRGLIQVRDAVRRCLRAQLDCSDESDLAASRAQLNSAYDRFVSRHGYLSERANTTAFRGDPDLPLLLSVEHYDEQRKRAVKAAIFRERTIQRGGCSAEIKTAQDALLVTLAERGRVDLDHIAGLLHRRSLEFLPELQGAVFLNPQTHRWETEDEYLSGNVRAKLAVAEAAALSDSAFVPNVAALKQVQPVDLNPSEIDARLGSTWIPAEDIQAFAEELLGESGINISHVPQLGLWSVRSNYSVKFSVANTTEHGTERRSAVELLEDALNLRTPTVHDYDDRTEKDTDGRKAALDLRLHKPELPDHPTSKVNLAVREVFRIWGETANDQLAQLVFCDLSVPTNGHGFSVYEDMRDKLCALGVPASEMAFIQDHDSDAAKLMLFRDVRAGRVRILFGSTQKMGTGTNVQQRLVALHHLDAPWRPADVEQREGRILRQGNQNPEVQIYRYVTEESFDAYMWQTLETKARFIAQVMTGETELRRIKDIDGAALTYAEVKAIASGNPMVIEKASVDAEVARLSRLRTQHVETQFRLRSQVRHLTDEIPRLERRLAEIRADILRRHDTHGDAFVMQIDRQEIRDRGIAGELLLRHAERIKLMRGERQVGEFAGFQVFVSHNFMSGADIVLKGAGTHIAKVGTTALGTIRSVEYVIQNLEETAALAERNLADTRKRIEDLKLQTDQPFEYDEKLTALSRRQDEIEDQLDLTKNQVAAQLDDGFTESNNHVAAQDGSGDEAVPDPAGIAQ